MSARLALWVWYRGDRFSGFQWQPGARSVQAELERALEPLEVTTRPMPAGRTDAGVHARMQVVMVKSELAPETVQARMNAALPEDVGVALARVANGDFQPHWSASGKEYRYRLALGGGAHRFAWSIGDEPRFEGRVVDPSRLREALSAAVGERVFSAFHSVRSPERMRKIESVELVDRRGGLSEIRIRGDAFARYQVRIMVGTAALVAAGVIPFEQWMEALEGKRRLAGIRAPAEALLLWDVRYPRELDPFSERDRAEAAGVPAQPPFD
ncbi:MAG: tRNA pseudouridine synthase A [Myxococcaceae bacterium]